MPRILVAVLKKVVNPVKVVTWALRAAGAGEFGPAVKKAYWALAGKKGVLVAAVAAIGAFLVQLQASSPADCNAIACSTLLEYIEKWGPAILAALTVSALDDAIRQEPPSEG